MLTCAQRWRERFGDPSATRQSFKSRASVMMLRWRFAQEFVHSITLPAFEHRPQLLISLLAVRFSAAPTACSLQQVVHAIAYVWKGNCPSHVQRFLCSSSSRRGTWCWTLPASANCEGAPCSGGASTSGLTSATLNRGSAACPRRCVHLRALQASLEDLFRHQQSL